MNALSCFDRLAQTPHRYSPLSLPSPSSVHPSCPVPLLSPAWTEALLGIYSSRLKLTQSWWQADARGGFIHGFVTSAYLWAKVTQCFLKLAKLWSALKTFPTIFQDFPLTSPVVYSHTPIVPCLSTLWLDWKLKDRGGSMEAYSFMLNSELWHS